MLFGVYFFINAIQIFLLAVFLVYIGSSPQESIIFNLSLSRLVLVLATLLVAFWFLFLAVQSFAGCKKIRALEEKFLGSESGLWLAFGICIALVCFVLFLLTHSRESFGNFKQIFQQLEPILVWMFLIGVRSVLFIAIWYSVYFLKNETERDIHEFQKELIPLLALFVCFVIVKLVFVTATAFGPIGSGDEMTYFTMADSFYYGIFSPREFNHYQYPPLYPLSLVPAFVFKGWAFEGVKLLNNLYSSSIIFPIYFISRRFLDKRKSLCVVLLSCLVPFHLVFPRRIVSENLYFPLFLWTMFITYVSPKNNRFRLPWDMLNGFMVGILYLTRYITLAAVPFFMLSWWIKPFEGEISLFKPGIKKIVHFFLMAIVIMALFCPWPILGITEGIPLKLMLGFGITSNTTAEQLTFSRLMQWSVLYGFYFILVSAPVLNLLIISLFQIDVKHLRLGFNRWIIQVLALMGGFFAAVTRHSWRAFYNAELPSKIMGRYLIVFSVLYFVIAMTALVQFKKSSFPSKWHFLLFAQLIPFGLVVVAYLTLIKGLILPTSGDLLKSLGSVDAFYIGILGDYFLLLIFLIFGIVNLFLWVGSKKIAFITLVSGLMIYYLTGIPAYYRDLMNYQTYPWLASRIAHLAPRPDLKSGRLEQITVFLPEDSFSAFDDEIFNGLYVRGFDNTKIEINSPEALKAMNTEKGFIIQPLDDDIEQLSDNPIYSFHDQEFIIIPVHK